MVVNLYSFVDNPFTKDARFDYKKFYETNYEAMRLSDDLVDLEVDYVQRIIDKILNDSKTNVLDKHEELELWRTIQEIGQSGRRTGLGFTALGDTLASLGLKYDSNEALEVIEKIMHTKMESELDCTTDLAILRGTFEGWDTELEKVD